MAAVLSPLTPRPYAWGDAANDTEPPDETALARRIMMASPSRDLAAEELFCRRFAPRIRLFGLKRLRSDAGAADLVQDVLILVLDKLRAGEVRDLDQIASFVFGTARQLVIDSRRTSGRRDAAAGYFRDGPGAGGRIRVAHFRYRPPHTLSADCWPSASARCWS